MHTPPGKPIRVYKKLRVCTDSHTATNFISKVAGREIVARDANCFHHFDDSVCSCVDYCGGQLLQRVVMMRRSFLKSGTSEVT
ncbi:hypothetical protein KC19_5G044900 [Ceratodon purpureus]|uniref:DYW domain-containing protein n=1 Tax=Ceratodon purpureus TaxID=3225 RepID=A0A8T0HXY5_CERPU|nr:hypothetical protein KC19_5G044900 [Ceratodon purpureus]